MFSQRIISPNLYFRLGLYEFEDIIRQVDTVDFLAPKPTQWFKYGTRIANRLAVDYACAVNPGIPNINVKKNYDLFFAVVMFPNDLLHVQSLHGWKEHCKISICWMDEFWAFELHKYRYFIKLLSQFDYVVVPLVGSLNALRQLVEAECFYLPSGIDAIRFCPYPNPPRRVIDVYSIGRRSEETHRALLRMTEDNQLFYVYDTMQGCYVTNPREHRMLYANIATRSKYFIVNPGKIDSPEETGLQSEFGPRFFEGAGSGTIMIGEIPKNDQFKKMFDWPDALIHLPFHSSNIGTIINELDKEPDRLRNIRRNNVVHSLLRHDWVYRWEVLLKTVGLDPLPELLDRKRRLDNLARTVERETRNSTQN